jgi:hypothetical protein
VETFTVNGLKEEVLRKCFEICNEYASCRFILKYEGENIQGTVQFLKRDKGDNWIKLNDSLKELNVNLG